MRIEVIGLGYIGLSTAIIFAKSGFDVIGVDQNLNVVETINKGDVHFEEPGLAEVIQDIVKNNKLLAISVPCEADAFIVAVPTPNTDDEYRGCDLTHVLSAVEGILPYLRKGNLVIIESTIAPLTIENQIKPVIEKEGFTIGEDIYLAHCPERVIPGQIMHELIHNNRVIGGVTNSCADKAAELYRTFVKGEIIKTDVRTAEMSKLMENTFRDVNIALANELAMICCELGIDVLDVIKIANKHPRVSLHMPGPGVGGHCLAVDPYFIYAKAPKTAKLIKLARDINNGMPEFVVDNTEKILKYDKSVPIAVFGVTYKPDVDDMRESPALKIIDKLVERGYKLRIHDPHVSNDVYQSMEDALYGAGLLLCLVGHKEFKAIDESLMALMAYPLVFDATGMLSQFPPSQYMSQNSIGLEVTTSQAKMNIEIINYSNLYDFILDRTIQADSIASPLAVTEYNRSGLHDDTPKKIENLTAYR